MEQKLCLCGCKQKVKNRFILGHNSRTNNCMKNPVVYKKYLKSMKNKVWNNKIRNQKISTKLKGNINGSFRINTKHNKKTIKKISNSKLGTHSHRKGINIEIEYGIEKANQLREKYRQNAINTLQKLGKTRISKAELKIEKYLKLKNIKYVSQYKYKMGVADFYLPKINTIIQCYGSYWHSKPDYIKRDKKQNKWFKDNSYNLIILNSEKIIKEGVNLNL